MIAHMESPVPDLLELRQKNLPTGWPAEKKELEINVPPWLLQVISKCLEKDPEKRFPNGMALQEALFLSSVDRKEFVAGTQSLEVLKSQNAALTAQLMDLKAKEINDAFFMKIPRRLVAGIVIILVAIVVFGGYGIFKKPTIKVVTKIDTVVKIKKVLVPDTVGRGYRLAQQKLLDSIAAADANNPDKAHRKKRKKFLGLF
jgi:eukaryotic-like serine/threonine-protein kinase